MNSSNPGGGFHALWLSAPHAPTPPPGFIRDVQPSTIRPSKHTEKSVSPSVVFAAARTDAVPSAAIQLRPADVPHAPALEPPRSRLKSGFHGGGGLSHHGRGFAGLAT